MKALGDLTDSAVECLKKPDIPGLAALMERNFALRRHMYGDDVVGKLNIQMADLASTFGLAAKFTGSGGALLCLLRNGQGWCVSTSFHTNCYDYDLPVLLDWQYCGNCLVFFIVLPFLTSSIACLDHSSFLLFFLPLTFTGFLDLQRRALYGPSAHSDSVSLGWKLPSGMRYTYCLYRLYYLSIAVSLISYLRNIHRLYTGRCANYMRFLVQITCPT
jgi:hypothetical protein